MVKQRFSDRNQRMGLRNSVRQQQDSAALSQKLQQALSQELAAQPMQVRCVIRDNTLLVLAEHLLHIEPNREETFSCLESAVRELQPKVGADPSLTAIKSLPVQLFLRIAGYQQPYATHKFKLDLSRSTQPVIQSARAPEPEPLNSSPIASPTAVMQLPVAPPEAPPTVAAAAPIAQAEPEVEAVAAQPEPATLTELIETPALTEQSELQESDQAEAIAAIRVEQQVVQSEPIATPTEPELAINADEFSLIEVETAEPTDESEAIEPEVTELEATELEAIELEAIELEVTEPKVTELEVTEPSTLEPTVAIAAPELTPVELDLVEPSIELDRVEPPVSSDGLAVALSSESTPVELPPTDSIETDSIEIVELIPEPTALFQDATESPAESPAELDRVKPDISDSPEILDSAVVELAPVDLPSVTEEVQSPGELELVIPDGDEQTAIEVEQVEPVEPAAVELDTEATALGLDSPAVINSVQPSTDEVDVTAVVDSDNPQTDESISLEALIAEAALTGVAVEAAQVEHDPVPALEVAGAEPSTESVLNAPDPAAPVSADLAENLDVTVEPEGDLAPDLAAMSAEALVELPPVELPPVEQRPVAQPELADSEISAEELAEGLDPSVLNREGFEPEGLEPEAIAEIISSTLEPDQPQLSVVDLPGQDGTELETEPASGIVEPEIVEGAGLEAVLSAPLAPELPQPEVALEALDPEPLASEELGLEPTAAEQDSLDGNGSIALDEFKPHESEPDEALELTLVEPILVEAAALESTELELLAPVAEPEFTQDGETSPSDWAAPAIDSEPDWPRNSAATADLADFSVTEAVEAERASEAASEAADQPDGSEVADRPYTVPDPWLVSNSSSLLDSESANVAELSPLAAPEDRQPESPEPTAEEVVELNSPSNPARGLPNAASSEVIVTAVMDWLDHQIADRADSGVAATDALTTDALTTATPAAVEPDLLIHELADLEDEDLESQQPDPTQADPTKADPTTGQFINHQITDQITDSYFNDEQAIFSESFSLPDDSSEDNIELGSDLDTTEIEPPDADSLGSADPAEPGERLASDEPELDDSTAESGLDAAPTRSSAYWAMGGVIGAVALAGGLYMLSRPCVVGSCDQIQLSEDLNRTALQTVQSTDSALDVVDAYKQLTEASYLLGTIPIWSPHYQTAQSLLTSYEPQSASLGQVVKALEQANTAAKRSQNPPHPLQEWREIQWLWREVVEKLETIPADSIVHGLAQRKLQEYRTNLSNINQRVVVEQQAQDRITAVRQVGQRAEAQAGAAQSAEQWQETTATWTTAIEQLQQIPTGTNAYDEAQQLLAVYQPKRAQAMARQGQEQTASTAYTQAVEAAERARRLEQQNQWVEAAKQWQNALTFAQQVPANSAYYSQVQPLIGTYTSTLQQAQINSQRSSAIQTAKSEFDQACDGSPTICTYTLSPQAIRVQFTPVYDQTVARLITNTQGSNGFPPAVVNQVNGLLRSLADISDLTQVPIELYNSNGTKLGTYTPALAGYVPQ